ncbi:ABC transporter permease subunit [Actinomadura rupiterrae]|uniref:ABC transporter permease subunit n=1 Tax=Actinomadura rupiterrae TaxID=559627 RepID=UPI0020A5145F|nr:ABC transporter permease subunit [Actinomadura rupiterrae]MCP2341244.1 ABC-type transport system involved in multi-copper enzyme maturation permease subunit [Actinomadura rupiterrae]
MTVLDLTQAPARPPLARLALVELRKMTDTRAGRWLLAIIALAAAAAVAVFIGVRPADEQSAGQLFGLSQIGVGLLLPVVGILAVTGEWSQRTALTTFALVPQRLRVLAAKVLAAVVLASGFVLLGLALAWLGRLVGGVLGLSSGAWGIPLHAIGSLLLVEIATALIGVAFGTLLMNTPVAIVLYFVLPTAWTTVGSMVKPLRNASAWLDTNRAFEPLNGETPATGTEWARAGTAVALWLVVPMLVGAYRLLHREVK